MQNKYVKRMDRSLFVQLFHILTSSYNINTRKLKSKSKIKFENTLDFHQLRQLQCKVTYSSSPKYEIICKVICERIKNMRGVV